MSIFRVASGVKWEKMAQNDKNCTSQESYVISFMLHFSRMMISPGFFFFFIFSKFCCSGLLGGKRAKNGPK